MDRLSDHHPLKPSAPPHQPYVVVAPAGVRLAAPPASARCVTSVTGSGASPQRSSVQPAATTPVPRQCFALNATLERAHAPVGTFRSWLTKFTCSLRPGGCRRSAPPTIDIHLIHVGHEHHQVRRPPAERSRSSPGSRRGLGPAPGGVTAARWTSRPPISARRRTS